MAKYTTKEERMYLRIRNLCGLLGIILPILAIFSASIAINSIFQFTKSRNTMTERKKLRNKVYRFCGYSMLALEAVFIVTRVTPCPGYWAMILEILLLLLFGFAWLVKGRAFPFINDAEEAGPGLLIYEA